MKCLPTYQTQLVAGALGISRDGSLNKKMIDTFSPSRPELVRLNSMETLTSFLSNAYHTSGRRCIGSTSAKATAAIIRFQALTEFAKRQNIQITSFSFVRVYGGLMGAVNIIDFMRRL